MGEYCPSCMAENADKALVCEVCGGDMNLKNRQHQLPVMTILDGRYLIGKVLGEGGFGITYIGLDLRINEKVAIKEFYPAGNVTRYSEHSMRVEATSADAEVLLKREGEKFLTEAQTMSRLNKVPNIVHVRDFFQANETSYIVMEFIDGETLASKLKKEGPQKEFSKLYAQLKPMMKSLDEVHKSGLIHRDISPSNLMLDKDGEVKLLDFGTAREVNADGEKSLSVVLKPGFAPEEQYRRRGKQGPWTDVYALCATIYKLCTGITPEISVDRLSEDTLVPPSKLGVKINKLQESALIRGLAVRQTDRIQTVGELIEEFDKTESGAKKLDLHQTQPTLHKPQTVPAMNTEGVQQADAEFLSQSELPADEPNIISERETAHKTRVKAVIIGLAICICMILAFAAVKAAISSIKQNRLLRDLSSAGVGDIVTFGEYEQDNDTSNGKEDIEWLVLAKRNNRILVISKYALDVQPYNKESERVTWETCTLRTWLNVTFLHNAFSENDQTIIQAVTVTADNNPYWNTDQGIAANDKVFLLSISEEKEYFASNDNEICVPTAYAVANGAYTSSFYEVNGSATCIWWLRSLGSDKNRAARVDYNGTVLSEGRQVDRSDVCVRPAMWISLDVASDTDSENNFAGNILSDYAAADVGDIIELGAYEQDNDMSNGKEPIEWQVLAKEDNKVLVISKYALDTKPYNTEYEDVTWETCTLRTWLNETFLNEAFSEAEQRIIQTTAVSADKNPNYSTNPGNATKDKIFLLSIDEANKYFASDEARMCASTAYAVANGALPYDSYKVDGNFSCYWWLRSPGSLQNLVATVDIDGRIALCAYVANSDGSVDYYIGYFVNDDYVCVRPAMWINLDA